MEKEVISQRKLNGVKLKRKIQKEKKEKDFKIKKTDQKVYQENIPIKELMKKRERSMNSRVEYFKIKSVMWESLESVCQNNLSRYPEYYQ